MVNSSENSTNYQDPNSISDLPSYDQGNQDEHYGEEENEEGSESYRSIQSIYEDTREIDEENAFFISAEEPSSYEVAVKEEIWRMTMNEEMGAIERNLTWDLVKSPENCRPIDVKWI